MCLSVLEFPTAALTPSHRETTGEQPLPYRPNGRVQSGRLYFFLEWRQVSCRSFSHWLCVTPLRSLWGWDRETSHFTSAPFPSYSFAEFPSRTSSWDSKTLDGSYQPISQTHWNSGQWWEHCYKNGLVWWRGRKVRLRGDSVWTWDQHCCSSTSCTWASLAPARSVTNEGDSKVSQLRAQVELSPSSWCLSPPRVPTARDTQGTCLGRLWLVTPVAQQTLVSRVDFCAFALVTQREMRGVRCDNLVFLLITNSILVPC